MVLTINSRSPKNVDDIALDPQPDWSFDSLLLELNSIDQKLNQNSSPFRKLESRELPASRGSNRKSRSFVMHFSDDEIEVLDSEDEEETEQEVVTAGRRFTCDELYISDSEDSEDGLALGIQSHLMEPVGLVEGALSEITHEHQLSVMEEMRTRISALEADLNNENEKFVSTLDRVDKSVETKQVMDRKLDMQYQRKIAEALDNHLTAVQRDHEHRSQMEERRIRDDAAREEARRREKALQEEKVQQEKLKEEAERFAEQEAERVRRENVAREEAEKTAAKEAAVRNALHESVKPASQETTGASPGSQSNTARSTVRGAESALKKEEQRLQTLKDLTAMNENLGLGTNKGFRSHGMFIARTIKQISGFKGSVSKTASSLFEALNNPSTPQSVSIAMFAEKFVSSSVNSGEFDNKLYAYARVIVSVTSQVPLAMDILIAELNRVCIFTVPKYISYSESSFESREAHLKAIGYREEDQKTETFRDRISAYMKLYGALVQTESFEGYQNLHGLAEGWEWLSRFLNALPANLYTATALQAFLQMAGFALYRRFKSQFAKLLQIVENNFLGSLKAHGDSTDSSLNRVIVNIQNYLDSRQYLKEPEGLELKEELESNNYAPATQNNYQSNQNYYQSNQNYHQPNRNHYQSNQNNYQSNQNYYQSNRYSNNSRY